MKIQIAARGRRAASIRTAMVEQAPTWFPAAAIMPLMVPEMPVMLATGKNQQEEAQQHQTTKSIHA
jgi:hypothetical protein